MGDILKNVRGPARVKAVMAAADVGQMDVKRETGFSLSYVRQVIECKQKGYRVRRAIARMCNVTVAYIWPDDEEGDPHLPKAA